MCVVGDIILIDKYKDIKSRDVDKHPFLVIDDENGQYKGFYIDFVGVAISSFKDDAHKNEVLKYLSNYEININDGVEKHSFVKLDVIHYFDKNKIEYRVVGKMPDETFNKIIQTLEILDSRGAVKENLNNL